MKCYQVMNRFCQRLLSTSHCCLWTPPETFPVGISRWLPCNKQAHHIRGETSNQRAEQRWSPAAADALTRKQLRRKPRRDLMKRRCETSKSRNCREKWIMMLGTLAWLHSPGSWAEWTSQSGWSCCCLKSWRCQRPAWQREIVALVLRHTQTNSSACFSQTLAPKPKHFQCFQSYWQIHHFGSWCTAP